MKTLLVGRRIKYSIGLERFGRGLLEGFGVGWLLVEPTAYFFPSVENLVKDNHVLIFGVIIFGSVAWGVKLSFLKLSKAARIRDTEIDIEVVVGDIFAFSNESIIVVSTTTTFDTCTDDDLISFQSLQGQVCKRFYKSSWHGMDAALKNKLIHATPSGEFQDGRESKTAYYPVGTTALIDSGKAKFYMLALTTMKANKRASAEFDDVQNALVGLWNYASEHGEFREISIPLLGMGNARVKATREDVIQAVIQSFIASCRHGNSRFCNRLRIVIGVDDFKEGSLNLDEIGEMLRCFCRTSHMGSPPNSRTGNAVPTNIS